MTAAMYVMYVPISYKLNYIPITVLSYIIMVYISFVVQVNISGDPSRVVGYAGMLFGG